MGIGRDHSRDHALRRVTYRQLRRKGTASPVRRGLAMFPPLVVALLLGIAAVPLVGGAVALAALTADLPSPQDLAKARSLGLKGMRERFAYLGGALEIGAATRGGTRVRVRVPMRGKEGESAA